MRGGEGADLIAVYALAERLGKFAHEVLQMPQDELHGWTAYLAHVASLNKQHGR
jgi:hypothetical protein